MKSTQIVHRNLHLSSVFTFLVNYEEYHNILQYASYQNVLWYSRIMTHVLWHLLYYEFLASTQP